MSARLYKLDAEAPRILARALNRGMTAARNDLGQAIRRELRPAKVSKSPGATVFSFGSGSVAMTQRRATYSRLEAVVRARVKGISLRHFVTDEGSRGFDNLMVSVGGVTYDMGPDVFVMRTRKGGIAVVRRDRSSGRLLKLYAPSVAAKMAKALAHGRGSLRGRTVFLNTLRHELRRIQGG